MKEIGLSLRKLIFFFYANKSKILLDRYYVICFSVITQNLFLRNFLPQVFLILQFNKSVSLTESNKLFTKAFLFFKKNVCKKQRLLRSFLFRLLQRLARNDFFFIRWRRRLFWASDEWLCSATWARADASPGPGGLPAQEPMLLTPFRGLLWL